MKTTKTTTPTFADDLRALMAAWSTIESAARTQLPHLSEEQRYRICKDAMNAQLATMQQLLNEGE